MNTPIDIMNLVREHVARYHGNMRALARETGLSYDLITKISQGRENITVKSAQLIIDHAAQADCERAA